jgi:hypothetical protein
VATLHDVRRLALELPGTSEKESRGQCTWIVNKKGFVWERPLRRGDLEALGENAPAGPILGVRTADLEMKEMLLASAPKIFFTTPHFDGYAAVLIPLKAISIKELKKVIIEAWLVLAPQRIADAYLEARPKRTR